MATFLEWIKTTFDQAEYQTAAIPLAFLLGLFSSIASACCTLPLLGAIVGYSGTRRQTNTRENLVTAACFMLGSIIALLILGSVAGFVGDIAEKALGKYWKIFAGYLVITAGLASLNLIPVTFFRKQNGRQARAGIFGAVMFGLIMGGTVSVCSLACNPGIFIILAAAVIQGYTFWMYGILTAYAIGFSLPLAMLVLGASFGKSAIKAKKAETVIRMAAGFLLIGIGFYMLATF